MGNSNGKSGSKKTEPKKQVTFDKSKSKTYSYTKEKNQPDNKKDKKK